MTPTPRYLPADLFGLDAIARRALSERPAPSGFGGVIVPDRLESIPDQVRDAARLEDQALLDRVDLADRLSRRLGELEPHPAVESALEDLARPDSLCVVAGQQPGLAGGPLLHLHKALHAVRLAGALREKWQRPVVAVFWNHGDDHDLAEGQHVWIRNRYHDSCRLGLSSLGSGRRPFAEVELGEEQHQIAAFGEAVRATLSYGREADAALELFLPRAGETLESAFTRVLSRLTGHLGLIVAEASLLRPLGGRALARFVVHDLEDAHAQAVERLAASGLATEAEDSEREIAWLYGTDAKGRRPLRVGGDGFRYDGEPGSRTQTELAAEIAHRPDAFTAGALLRTLVQDAILPSVATVGGFGELAYWIRTAELRERVGLRPAVFVPRVHATLCSPGARRALARAELEARVVLERRPTEPTPKQPLDPRAREVVERLRELGKGLRADLAELRPKMAEVDRGLSVRSKRTAAEVTERLDQLADRLERAARNRRGKEDRHRRHAAAVLCPLGEPQERVQSILQTTVELGGVEWIDTLAGSIDPLPTEHLLLELDREGTEPRPAEES